MRDKYTKEFSDLIQELRMDTIGLAMAGVEVRSLQMNLERLTQALQECGFYHEPE